MNKIIVALVIIVIVIFGGYFLINNGNQLAENGQSLNSGQPVVPGNDTIQPVSEKMVTHEVIYTDTGYSPKELTIKIGDTVVWKNQSSHGMWIGSALHPSHFIYSGTSLDEHCPDPNNTSFDQCTSSGPSTSWSFKFDKKGTWRYHNHVSASDFGTVIVQ